ncbi:hypothetical protein JCM8547_002333 [Rhodosporidiobolus lusitaniae]
MAMFSGSKNLSALVSSISPAGSTWGARLIVDGWRLDDHAPELRHASSVRTLKNVLTGKTLSNSLSASPAVVRVTRQLADTPTPHDVCLVFPRPASDPLRLYANRDLLSSPYFHTLFSSDFAEATAQPSPKRPKYSSAEAGENEFDASDDETDKVYDEKKPLRSILDKEQPELSFHEITVTEASYSTYKAILLFLTTGYIDFAPLRSTSLPLNAKATSTRADTLASRSSKSPSLPFAASPKSVYRLAHFLDLSDVRSLALARIKSPLQVETAALELFSPTSLAYQQVQKVVVEFVVGNLSKVEATESYKNAMEAVERGERPEAAPVLVKLLQAQRRKGRGY